MSPSMSGFLAESRKRMTSWAWSEVAVAARANAIASSFLMDLILSALHVVSRVSSGPRLAQRPQRLLDFYAIPGTRIGRGELAQHFHGAGSEGRFLSSVAFRGDPDAGQGATGQGGLVLRARLALGEGEAPLQVAEERGPN